MSGDPVEKLAKRIRRWWLGSTTGAYTARFGGAIAVVLAARESLAKFDLHPFPRTAPGLSLLIVSALALYFGGEFFRLLLHSGDVSASKLFAGFVRHLDDLLSTDKNEAVIRYHAGLSRLLWVEGELTTRVDVGKRIAQAAAAIGDTRTLAAVLIDDLGWTYVALRDYDDARDNITRGIEIADQDGAHYWSAKGHRHLAGIAMERSEWTLASQEFECARDTAEHVEPRKTRLELLAGIDYGEAIACLRLGKTEEAMVFAEASERRRLEVGDESRIVKVYALRGEIEEHRGGSVTKAAEYFQRGLATAKRIGRVDEEIRCLQGLARIEKDKERKKTLEASANRLKAGTPISHDAR
jgi:tetratricopeptide (TPR) repeat protein